MGYSLEGKVAFVTGAAQGIGKAIAVTLAQYGADIVAADMKQEGLKVTAEEIKKIGRRVIIKKMDVSVASEVKEAVQEAMSKFAKIDILVNAAGIVNAAKISDLEESTWDRVMDTNAKGVFLCSGKFRNR